MDIEKEFNLARRHKDFDEKIFERLKKQDDSLVESVATPEARKVYNWNRQVWGTYQRGRAFIRLNVSKHGIVYGKIEPEHFVEDMVAEWFLSRFPMFLVMIESKRGTFVVGKDYPLTKLNKKIDDILPDFEKILPENPLLLNSTDFSEKDWENFYLSQNIKERKNKKYMLKNIPKKFHGWDGLNLEKKLIDGNRELKEFIG